MKVQLLRIHATDGTVVTTPWCLDIGPPACNMSWPSILNADGLDKRFPEVWDTSVAVVLLRTTIHYQIQ